MHKDYSTGRVPVVSCSPRVDYTPLTNWRGRDTVVDGNGYVRVWVPEHPKAFCGGWVYEHRLVAEREYGRLLDRTETVHHISEQKTDNRWINLFVCYMTEHSKAHDFAYEF